MRWRYLRLAFDALQVFLLKLENLEQSTTLRDVKSCMSHKRIKIRLNDKEVHTINQIRTR
jgi:hypothetical protein